MDDLIETLRLARKADREAFWAYGNACVARDQEMANKLDKAREATNRAADLALTAFLAALDESP